MNGRVEIALLIVVLAVLLAFFVNPAFVLLILFALILFV